MILLLLFLNLVKNGFLFTFIYFYDFITCVLLNLVKKSLLFTFIYFYNFVTAVLAKCSQK